MTGRESHRPAERTRAGGDGTMGTSGPFLPAQTPQRPAAAVTSTGSATAAAPTYDLTARFLLHYARTARDLGVHVPFEHELEGAARRLLALDWPTCATASNPPPSATVEIGTAEMAHRMGCSQQWVRELCQAGRMPGARKAGRVWRITTQEEAHGYPAGSDRG